MLALHWEDTRSWIKEFTRDIADIYVRTFVIFQNFFPLKIDGNI